MKKFKDLLTYLILPIAIITLICGFIYVSVQQNIKMAANDPQVQIAEDAISAINNGQIIQSIIPTTKIDIAKSLAPFIICYDKLGNPTASSGLLNGEIPNLKPSTFEYTKLNNQNIFTWEPESNVRIAAVMIYNSGKPGFVLVGRSVREIEKLEGKFIIQTIIVWLGCIILYLLILFFMRDKYIEKQVEKVPEKNNEQENDKN